MKIYTVGTLPSPYYEPTSNLKWVLRGTGPLESRRTLVQEYTSSIYTEDDIWVEVPVEDLGKKSKEKRCQRRRM